MAQDSQSIIKQNDRMKISRPRVYWLVILVSSCSFFVASILSQFEKFGVSYPLGWDPPFYVMESNIILKTGILGNILNNGFGLFELLLSLSSYLLRNGELALILWQIGLSISFIILSSLLALRVTHSFLIASLTGIFTSLVPNTIRLYVLPRQLFALDLCLIVLCYLSTLSSNRHFSLMEILTISMISGVVAWIDPLTFVLPLISFAILTLFARKSALALDIFKCMLFSSVIAVLPLAPHLGEIFTSVVYVAPSFFAKTQPTFAYYASEFANWGGGTEFLAALSCLGLLILLIRHKLTKEFNSLALVSFSIGSIFLFNISFLLCFLLNDWYVYADRSLLIFPASIMLATTVGLLSKKLEDLITSNKFGKLPSAMSRKGFIRGISILISVIVICSMISVPFGSQLTLDVQTWISKDTYNKLVQVQNVLEKLNYSLPPIFMFYNTDPDLISYYSSIIGMLTGQHYLYYGKLQFLDAGLPTPAQIFEDNSGESQLADSFFQDLRQSNVLSRINDYPIVLLIPDFYSGDSSSSNVLQSFEFPGGFCVIPPRENQTRDSLLGSLITCYTDYYNSSGDFYSERYNQTIAPMVLEHYSDDTNNSESWVSYSILLFNYPCKIDVRMFDAAPNWNPVQIYLDEKPVLIYDYRGSMTYVNVTLNLSNESAGFHVLKFETAGEMQILRLDVIFISFDASRQ